MLLVPQVLHLVSLISDEQSYTATGAAERGRDPVSSLDLPAGSLTMVSEMEDGGSADSLENRPGVFLIGCPNVGKRTLLSRLLSVDIPDIPNLSSGVLCQEWTLETKYYSAKLSIWTGHLDEEFSFQKLVSSNQLAALVMVFDMSDESSFLALKNWVAGIELGKFEILLCIGNKADLVPGHYAHAEYSRCLQKYGESSEDPHPEFWDYGINETQSCSLLGNEDPSVEIKKSCMEWCVKQNIEYIEACASDVDFDKCLSFDGDIQGVERLYGALSSHMWPGMILKSGNRINFPAFVEKEDFTDDESNYEIEYEVLSGVPDEPWDNSEIPCASSSMLQAGNKEGSSDEGLIGDNEDQVYDNVNDHVAGVETEVATAAPSNPPSQKNEFASDAATEREHHTVEVLAKDKKHEEDTGQGQVSNSEVKAPECANAVELDEDSHFGYDNLDSLMGEIGNMRGNLRLMPDFQRREMAAKLAMKMAAMFGESSDEDGF